MAQTLATQNQVPSNSILDFYNKQAYLGNQYIAALNNQTVGTSEIPIILFKNPSTSPVALFLNLKRYTAFTTGQAVGFRHYLNPTVTNVGTTIVTSNSRCAYGTANQQALVTSVPTVSSNGQFLALLASTAYTPTTSMLLNILDPGQTFLITAQASAASVSYVAELSWYEL